MKQRVATAQTTLKASALSGQNRAARITAFLDTVEQALAHKQQQIGDLTNERDRALGETVLLREMLNVMLEHTEKLENRDQGMGGGRMDELLDRLDEVVSIQ